MNLFGKPCLGSHTDKGYCNSFDCSGVSTYLLNFIQNQLKLNNYGIEAHINDKVSIKLPSPISKHLAKQNVPYVLMWMFNGVFLNQSNSSELLFESVSSEETGIYTCFIRFTNKRKYPVMVYSLAVKNNRYDFNIDFNSRHVMKCYGIYLAQIYSGLSQKWFLNDKVYEYSDIVYGDKTILEMNKTHNGVWKCVIEKSKTNFSWTAGIYYINVKGAEDSVFLFIDKYPVEIYLYLYTLLSLFIFMSIVTFILLYRLKKKYRHFD